MNVSFDFDGTLHRNGDPLWPAMRLLRWHHRSGNGVLIVTTRTESHEDPSWWRIHEPCRVLVADFLSQFRLPVQRVVFTSHELKAASLLRHRIELHYDDDPAEVAAATNAGIRAVLLNGDPPMHDISRHPRITVIGDLILDRYLIGDVAKLNPEQPGVVIRIRKEDDRLGGAAAVAMIASGIEAHVTLAGVLGRDNPGHRTLALIDAHNIAVHIWRGNRPTTWKQRIVVGGQIRSDRCDREVTKPVTHEAADFLATVALGNTLLIQDYGKGVCTKRLLSSLVARANEMNVPVLVDPARGRKWSDYGKVTLIKANWTEASEAENVANATPRELARILSDRYDCHVVITRGERGLVCGARGGDTWSVPGKRVAVQDVCGAGDTVLATLGAALARGCSLGQACAHAVVTSAEQVTKMGVSSIKCNLLQLPNESRDEIASCMHTIVVGIHDDNAIANSRALALHIAGP